MEIREIERALVKRYRAKIFKPFVQAINTYNLIEENDVIGVCISGGKDSLTMAKLFQELKRHNQKNFEVKFLVMDPGYNEKNLKSLIENCKKLEIPITIKVSNIFEVASKLDPERPCYMCARMRRGFLYEFAREEGCNKIALGHHKNDVIETILMNIFYNGTFKTMMPKLKAANFENMELIRPMTLIEEKNIINYMKYCQIEALSCACKVASKDLDSYRKKVKALISDLKKEFKDIEKCIYNSANNINLDCATGWKHRGKEYSFQDFYDENNK